VLSDYPDYDHLINHVSVQLEGNGDDDDHDFGRLGDLDDGFSAINSYLIGDMFVLKYDVYSTKGSFVS